MEESTERDGRQNERLTKASLKKSEIRNMRAKKTLK